MISTPEFEMKKLLLSTAVLALTTASALAADLPSRKAEPLLPPPPPPPMWTGFYAGLNAGGTWGASNGINMASGPVYLHPTAFTGSFGNALYDWALPSAAGATGTMKSSAGGFIGGGQIGYNWQAPYMGGKFVVGLEADIQGIAGASSRGSMLNTTAVGSAISSSSSGAPITTIASASRSIDYLGTVRGRLGYLVTPTLLVYGTGGLAYGGVSLNAGYWSAAPTISRLAELNDAWGGMGNYSTTRSGWTAGGGLEWMFMPNWSAKVEYLYYDLGTVALSLSPAGSVINAPNDPRYGQHWWLNASQVSARFNGNVVRAGVNYHFNFGAAPVVAKY
jgi:outer membrane immunogenic protein